MKIRYAVLGIVTLIGAALVPSIATSENQTQTLCGEFLQLQHDDVSAVFTAFRGDDDVAYASALLRARMPNGAVPASTANRFALAQKFVKTDPAAKARRARLAQMRLYSDIDECSALQNSALMQVQPATE